MCMCVDSYVFSVFWCVSTWDPVALELRIARTPMALELRIARTPMALELRIARTPMALELRIAQGKVCFYMDSMCFYLIYIRFR